MSDHLDAETVDRLRMALTRISRRIDRQVSGGGLSTTQLSVLASVAVRGPLGISELAEAEGINPTMLSRIVGKLEEAGLIERAVDADDRRAARVGVTPAGARLRNRMIAERSKLLGARLDELPPELASVLIAAIPALEGLAAELAPPARPAMTSMTELRTLGRQTFSSLDNPNYRRYLSGQSTSLIGTWMQSVAQSWLVLTLSHSATVVGLAIAVQTLPVLLVGPYAGVIADRTDKRRLMMVLQTMMGLQAAVLGVLTITHEVKLWQVFLLALVLGCNNAFENPARQSFVLEIVGREHLRNAVSLNSVMVNVARAVGPAVAGVIIASGGIGFCFLLNALSFAAVVTSLIRLDVSQLTRSEPAARARGQLREGFAYVRRTPSIAVPLGMMALIGCFAFEFQVVLPVLAKHDLHGNSETYGFITSAMGAGAIVGGLWVAARGRTGTPTLVKTCMWMGLAMTGAALAPNLAVELVAIALVGAISIATMSQGNSTVQLNSAPNMRGRVMGLWAVAFMGSTPIGGPIAGGVSEVFGGRGGLLLGAIACLLAALMGRVLLRRAAARDIAEPATVDGNIAEM